MPGYKGGLRQSLLLCAVLLAAACGNDRGEIRLVGTVERTLVEMVAPVSEVIVEIGAARGDRVEAGEVLVRLDTILADAEIARADAALAGARTGALVAQQDLERAQQLKKDRVASQQALDRARLARDEATARLREAGALASAARKRRNDLILTSPVAGTLDQLPFDRGERVPAGAVVAVVLEDAAPWVRVWIPEWSFARVHPGSRAEITIDGLDGVYRGTVIDIAREPEFTPHYALTERDREYLVFETRVRIDDPPAVLRPGIPAEVLLVPDPAPRVAAP